MKTKRKVVKDRKVWARIGRVFRDKRKYRRTRRWKDTEVKDESMGDHGLRSSDRDPSHDQGIGREGIGGHGNSLRGVVRIHHGGVGIRRGGMEG